MDDKKIIIIGWAGMVTGFSLKHFNEIASSCVLIATLCVTGPKAVKNAFNWYRKARNYFSKKPNTKGNKWQR